MTFKFDTDCEPCCIHGTLWDNAKDLLTVLQKTLSKNGSKVLLTLRGYTFGLWKSQDLFGLFDSHSRDSKCKCVPEVKAFCGSYSALEDLCCVIFQNYRDDSGNLQDIQTEVTPVDIILEQLDINPREG